MPTISKVLVLYLDYAQRESNHLPHHIPIIGHKHTHKKATYDNRDARNTCYHWFGTEFELPINMKTPKRERHRCAKCGEYYNPKDIHQALNHVHHTVTFRAIISWSREMMENARGKEFDVTVINLN